MLTQQDVYLQFSQMTFLLQILCAYSIIHLAKHTFQLQLMTLHTVKGASQSNSVLGIVAFVEDSC
jgi:hypothetical protein